MVSITQINGGISVSTLRAFQGIGTQHHTNIHRHGKNQTVIFINQKSDVASHINKVVIFVRINQI